MGLEHKIDEANISIKIELSSGAKRIVNAYLFFLSIYTNDIMMKPNIT